MEAPRGGRSGEGRPPSREGEPWAPLGSALRAWAAGHADAFLLTRTDVGEDEAVPVALFFRGIAEMGAVERAALQRARGRVLDLGAGPGAHSAPLVERGLTVTAAEILPEARAALERVVDDVRAGGLETLAPDERFDTILVLMNGLGLPGTLAALEGFLADLGAHLAPGGQVLADSTDPREWPDPEDGRYPGEVHMQLEFPGAGAVPPMLGPPFPFLFVDPDTLAERASRARLSVEVVAREPDGRYLARIRSREDGGPG